jgi:hypothetical protein
MKSKNTKENHKTTKIEASRWDFLYLNLLAIPYSLNAIQRSNKKLCFFWAIILVWRDQIFPWA